MVMRPKALDLCCGAGGASVGLYRAGFDVVGIDWMLNREMAEAIPPAYAEFIGRQAMRFIQASAAAA